MKKIKKGDKIMVDRGYKTYHGTFLKVKGFSCGGFWGEFRDTYGKKRLFDETIDRIILI